MIRVAICCLQVITICIECEPFSSPQSCEARLELMAKRMMCLTLLYANMAFAGPLAVQALATLATMELQGGMLIYVQT